MNQKKKQTIWKGFTLIELLVVVILLAVLATVAVPKFSRVLDTRKTQEAEQVMAAVRTEQEQRCVFGKNYLVEPTKVAAITSAGNSHNYSYNLLSKGMTAAASDYTLKMWYKTGELCCEGEGCDKLNKNYPACAAEPTDECAGNLDENPSEHQCSGSPTDTGSCGCFNRGTKTRSRTCDTSTGSWSNWSDWVCDWTNSTSDCCDDKPGTTWDEEQGNCVSTGPVQKPCEGESTKEELCGCKNQGTKQFTRTCDTTTGTWSAWEEGTCNAINSTETCCNPATQTWDGTKCVDKPEPEPEENTCEDVYGTRTKAFDTDEDTCDGDTTTRYTCEGTARTCTDVYMQNINLINTTKSYQDPFMKFTDSMLLSQVAIPCSLSTFEAANYSCCMKRLSGGRSLCLKGYTCNYTEGICEKGQEPIDQDLQPIQLQCEDVLYCESPRTAVKKGDTCVCQCDPMQGRLACQVGQTLNPETCECEGDPERQIYQSLYKRTVTCCAR